MSDADPAAPRAPPLLHRLIADPRVQRLAERLPVVSAFARRDGRAIFDILQGFVAAQTLSALLELGVLDRLQAGPAGAAQLSHRCGLSEDRLTVLLTAGVALKLLRRRRDGRYALARRGAAVLGVPGLRALIDHDRAFYADMADPAALLRGEGKTELARFWPYVLGPGASDPAVAARYSGVMEGSQALVADDTLRQAPLGDVRRLMDVGGGSGAFLAAALARHPRLQGVLVDLPDVTPLAEDRLRRAGLADRVQVHGQSFREGPLPRGADAISLVRVLYDHDDATVAGLLSRAFEALPPGGRLIVSEPMSGGARPDRHADVYFAFYTLAMGTGRVRSQDRIAELCAVAGFDVHRAPRPRRPFVTSLVTAVRPA